MLTDMICAARWALCRSLVNNIRGLHSKPLIDVSKPKILHYNFLSNQLSHRAISAVAPSWPNTPFIQDRLCSCVLVTPCRSKSTKSKKNRRKESSLQEELSDSEDSDEEDVLESGADFRDLKAKVSSLRLDAILKAGLNMSRNKVEAAFYESRIRINGEKVMKKSKHLQEYDEVDIIKSQSNTNPDLVNISRVVVLKIGMYNEDSDKIQIRLRRYPQLLVQKYEEFQNS